MWTTPYLESYFNIRPTEKTTMHDDIIKYSKTPIYRAPIYLKPRFTTANVFPQIGLNMYIVYC